MAQQEQSRNTGETGFEAYLDYSAKIIGAATDAVNAAQSYWQALARYEHEFVYPLFKAMCYFSRVEGRRMFTEDPLETMEQYDELLRFNQEIFIRSRIHSAGAAAARHATEMTRAFAAWLNTLSDKPAGEDVFGYLARTAKTAAALAREYPEEIMRVAEEFGYHFERGGYDKIAETDRFTLYRVHPTDPKVTTRMDGKPILIVHPYVLGADILAFLPGDNKSYVHCFANQGIPTYVRILKKADDNPAVRDLTLEDDIRDMKLFCETIRVRHGRPLTLNGYCQGGLITMANLLSGELDGLVDTHITCVAPIDGTRSKGLGSFLTNLPQRFNDLAYGTRVLADGGEIADGDLMAWVYKIKSIEDETPEVALFRDLEMMDATVGRGKPINKTAAAVTYWLTHQRHDLPQEITKLSFASYNIPITADGTLPFTAFGRPLNMKHIAEQGIRWLICYGESDTLVERETALAPLDYIDAEVSAFPKGHVAMVTSWSLPTSECALHCSFGGNNTRGPVCFHLDVEREENEKRQREAAPDSPDSSGSDDGGSGNNGSGDDNRGDGSRSEESTGVKIASAPVAAVTPAARKASVAAKKPAERKTGTTTAGAARKTTRNRNSTASTDAPPTAGTD
ncbi:MAG: metal transporter [Deltaproteobacteria bacterium]|nr:metal transporter [Candidatus Anaeroferrophillacea bacterium]